MPEARIRQILRSLKDHDVRFIVVGGVAAVLNGAPVNTFDIDIEMTGADNYKQTITNADGTKSVEYYERVKK